MIITRRLASTTSIPPPRAPILTKTQIFERLRGSGEVMKKMTSLITVMESHGLTTHREPTPEEWSSLMTNKEVQSALKALGDACDEAGVPINAQIFAELKAGLDH